ncbi:MAG: type II secretion system F family protein [Lachnospiraceae bacterium]|nr:type II secretion system F family protein [Lachnospiraceae bacterium]
MAKFVYTALTPEGKKKKGQIEAGNEDAVKSALKAEGLIPVEIRVPSALDSEITIGGGVPAKDLSMFCTQMASILHAGVTIIQALGMMEDQSSNKRLKEAVKNCRILVEKGETLAGAFSQYPTVFPEILINMIEAGEASGSLETSFIRMAEQFEKDNKVKNMVTSALIYPVVLLVVIIGVVIIMLVKVVPSFQETFDEAGAKLPALTLAVVALSKAVQHSWYIILIVIVAIVIAINAWKQTDDGAMAIGRMTLKFPLIGDLSIKSASARFARTMSTLTASGIPLVNAIEICGKVMSNRVIQAVIQDAKEDVERGVPLSQPLEASGVFPPLLYQMTRIGEETGNVEEMLDRCADFYEEEVERATQTISTVLEPVIIIVMALIVVPIIGAVMLPMLSIYSAVENA